LEKSSPLLEEKKLTVTGILETHAHAHANANAHAHAHAHADHLSSFQLIKKKFPKAKIAIGSCIQWAQEVF
jgi:hypothetical protein